MTPSILKTKRLILRPFQLADAPDLQRLIGDYDVSKTLLVVPYPYVDGEAERFINSTLEETNRDTEMHWAITLDKNLIGGSGLKMKPEEKTIMVGYWLGKDFWGKGYMTEALREIINYAFQSTQAERVEACHFASNPASGKVMQKAGMVFTEIRTQCYETMEGKQDGLHYSISRSQWEDLRQNLIAIHITASFY